MNLNEISSKVKSFLARSHSDPWGFSLPVLFRHCWYSLTVESCWTFGLDQGWKSVVLIAWTAHCWQIVHYALSTKCLAHHVSWDVWASCQVLLHVALGNVWNNGLVLSYKALLWHAGDEFLAIGVKSAVRSICKLCQSHHRAWLHQSCWHFGCGSGPAEHTCIQITGPEDGNRTSPFSILFGNDKLQSEHLSNCILKVSHKTLVPF